MLNQKKWVLTAAGLCTLSTGCPFTSCFVAGTNLNQNGSTHRNDSRGRTGVVDEYDTGQRILRPVSAIVIGSSAVTHRIEAGELSIPAVTSEHPFWSPSEQRWIAACELQTGATLCAWLVHDTKNISVQHTQRTQQSLLWCSHCRSMVQNTIALPRVFSTQQKHRRHRAGQSEPFESCIEVVHDGEATALLDFGDVYTAEDAVKIIRLERIEDCFSPIEPQTRLEIIADDPEDVFDVSLHTDTASDFRHL